MVATLPRRPDLLHNQRVPLEALVADKEPCQPWHIGTPNKGHISKSQLPHRCLVPVEIHVRQVFDLRLLFLFTALCPDQRDIAKHNHDGVLVLREAIQVRNKSVSEPIRLFYPQAILEGKATMDEPCLDSEECAVICEMLKVTDLKKLSP